MSIRGVRGAVTASADQPQEILAATSQLLTAVCRANPTLQVSDIASLVFTVTPDLRAAYPAAAARQMGWTEVPMLCTQEMTVPGSLPRCIRLLLHWNTDLSQAEVQHVYLGAAAALRPDLAGRTAALEPEQAV